MLGNVPDSVRLRVAESDSSGRDSRPVRTHLRCARYRPSLGRTRRPDGDRRRVAGRPAGPRARRHPPADLRADVHDPSCPASSSRAQRRSTSTWLSCATRVYSPAGGRAAASSTGRHHWLSTSSAPNRTREGHCAPPRPVRRSWRARSRTYTRSSSARTTEHSFAMFPRTEIGLPATSAPRSITAVAAA